jgi:hypothetical protein
MPEATLMAVKEYFGYPTLKAFSDDWKQMPEKDRKQIREGIGNGTFTY